MSDIDTAVVDSLKVLDPKRPIREADIESALFLGFGGKTFETGLNCMWEEVLEVKIDREKIAFSEKDIGAFASARSSTHRCTFYRYLPQDLCSMAAAILRNRLSRFGQNCVCSTRPAVPSTTK